MLRSKPLLWGMLSFVAASIFGQTPQRVWEEAALLSKGWLLLLVAFFNFIFLNVFLLVLVVLFLPLLVGHGFGGKSIFLWPCLHCSFQLGEEKAHEDPCYGE